MERVGTMQEERERATNFSEEIKNYWETKSLTPLDDEGLRPTGRDSFLQEAVEEAIIKHLPPGKKILDIGCGDGLSTVAFARSASSVVAIDYVENYVKQAKELFAHEGLKNVECLPGDIRILHETVKPYQPFDVAITIRCLINLPTEAEQFRAVDRILDCLPEGGLYICSEGWSESWAALDETRQQCGLGKMYLVPHNTLISKERFVKHLAPKADLIAYESLGFYVFLSRVLQPMVMAPERPRHLHPINKVAKQLYSLGIAPADFDEIGYPGVCVFRKKV